MRRIANVPLPLILFIVIILIATVMMIPEYFWEIKILPV